MRHKKLKISTLVILLIGGYLVTRHSLESSNPLPERYGDKTTNAFCSSIRNEYGIHCIGSGGSVTNSSPHLDLVFRSDETPSVERARILIVNSIEVLLESINSEESLQDYLSPKPYDSSGLYFVIGFNRRCVEPSVRPFVATVFTCRDRLCYFEYDIGNDSLIDLHEEPYEEALRIVKESGQLSLLDQK